MVEFKVTPRIRDAVDKALSSSCLKEDLRERLLRHNNTKISLATAKDLTEFLRTNDIPGTDKCRWVHELLEGSEKLVSSTPIESDEQTARRKALREQQMEREYSRMVKSVSRSSSSAREPKELKMYNESISFAVGLIVTMASVFVAAFWAFNRAYGPTVGVIAGLVCAMIVMGAEIWLMMIRSARQEENQRLEEKNRKKREAAHAAQLAKNGLTTTGAVIETHVIEPTKRLPSNEPGETGASKANEADAKSKKETGGRKEQKKNV